MCPTCIGCCNGIIPYGSFTGQFVAQQIPVSNRRPAAPSPGSCQNSILRAKPTNFSRGGGLLKPAHHSVYKDFGFPVEKDPSILLEPHLKGTDLSEEIKDYYTLEELEDEFGCIEPRLSEKKMCRTVNRELGESNLTENREKNRYHEYVKIRNELNRLGIRKEPPLKESAFKLRVWRERKMKM